MDNNPNTQKGPYFLDVKFVEKLDSKYLEIKGRKNCVYYAKYSDDRTVLTEDDLKSLIIDRDTVFANNLKDNAKANIKNPLGENALVWNVFRTLTIADRWDVFFNSPDLITGKPITPDQELYRGRKLKTYFWNIMPGTGYFNYHYAKMIYHEVVPMVSMEEQVELDFWGLFNKMCLYVEAKLNSNFDTCPSREFLCARRKYCGLGGQYSGKFSGKPEFTFGRSNEHNCHYFHQLLRNFSRGELLRSESDYGFYKYLYCNVINEKSPHFKSNLKKTREFAEKMDPETHEIYYKDYEIHTTSWQKIRATLAKTIDKDDRNQRKLLVYLIKHPRL